jgi:high-affinity iron transporter
MAELMIMFRETLEMSLIIGIVSTYLIKTDNKSFFSAIYSGVFAAILSSIVLAVFFEQFIDGGFSGFSEELFEGIIMIFASILLGSMVIWMTKNKDHSKQLQQITEKAINSKNTYWGIFVIVFLSVLREGIEIVLFLYGIILKNGGISILLSSLGVCLALIIGYVIFYQGKKLPLEKFFQYSSIMLIFIAAGLLAHGIHELEEAGVIPYDGFNSVIWDINPSLNEQQIVFNTSVPKHEEVFPLFHEKGGIGNLAKAIFGYNGNPSKIEFLSWLIAISLLFYFSKSIILIRNQ